MMQSAWALTSGSYSDYRVLAVFLRKEDAEEAFRVAQERAADIWDVADSIEELAFYGPGEQPQLITTYIWLGVFSDDGTGGQTDASERVEWQYSQMERFGPRPRVRFMRRTTDMRLEVVGTDLQAVRQAWSDNAARVAANISIRGRAEL